MLYDFSRWVSDSEPWYHKTSAVKSSTDFTPSLQNMQLWGIIWRTKRLIWVYSLTQTGSVKIQQLLIGLLNGFIGKTKGWHDETTPTWERRPRLISKELGANRGLAELWAAPNDCVSDTDAKRCVYPTLSAIHQLRQCSSVASTYNDKESWRGLRNISELFVMCVCSNSRLKNASTNLC